MLKPKVSRVVLQRSAFICSLLTAANSSYADHGPGTSGGGSATQSGETMKPGKFAVELREDFTEFEHLSNAEIVSKAFRAGDIDLLDRSFIESVSVSYGVIEDFQVGMTIGYYQAVNSKAAEFDPTTGVTSLSTSNPDGLTDLWINAKYRFYHGPIGSLAVIGGIKIPTGRSKVLDSTGASLEPSATAGSGAYDGMLGLAFSRFITAQLTIDSSFQYTIRGGAQDFKLGDRIDGGVALAYRLTKDIKSYPQLSVFGEANVRYLFKSEDAGVLAPNTGGTALFLTPGFRASFNQNFSFTAAAPLPVLQSLNGEQLKTAYKISAALTASF
ncbi:MAG: hypothetical protein JWN25_1375 [Verrucomicrobiales bacterium]|nr:hypothetical protein [Verrucomicrobiales bacterium]